MPPPIPSRHNFEALIEDLFAGTDPEGDAPRVPHRVSVDSLEAAWDLAFSARTTPRKSETVKPSVPFHGYDGADAALDVSLDPCKILSELGLRPEATEADIVALRREFALRNHPDRVPVELRELATQRMMIANDLMDRHIAKLRKKGI